MSAMSGGGGSFSDMRVVCTYGVGEGCSGAVVCGVQFVLCVCGGGGGGGGWDVVVLWWGMVWSYPCGMFVWESRLVPTFAIWVLWGLTVQCSNTAFLGFPVSLLF